MIDVRTDKTGFADLALEVGVRICGARSKPPPASRSRHSSGSTRSRRCTTASSLRPHLRWASRRRRCLHAFGSTGYVHRHVGDTEPSSTRWGAACQCSSPTSTPCMPGLSMSMPEMRPPRSSLSSSAIGDPPRVTGPSGTAGADVVGLLEGLGEMYGPDGLGGSDRRQSLGPITTSS